MIDGRCKQCRHWEPFDRETNAPRSRRAGLRKFGLCRKANGINEDKTSLAYAEDGSDYIADLRTSPDFGCVMYEAKPEAPT